MYIKMKAIGTNTIFFIIALLAMVVAAIMIISFEGSMTSLTSSSAAKKSKCKRIQVRGRSSIDVNKAKRALNIWATSRRPSNKTETFGPKSAAITGTVTVCRTGKKFIESVKQAESKLNSIVPKIPAVAVNVAVAKPSGTFTVAEPFGTFNVAVADPSFAVAEPSDQSDQSTTVNNNKDAVVVHSPEMIDSIDSIAVKPSLSVVSDPPKYTRLDHHACIYTGVRGESLEEAMADCAYHDGTDGKKMRGHGPCFGILESPNEPLSSCISKPYYTNSPSTVYELVR